MRKRGKGSEETHRTISKIHTPIPTLLMVCFIYKHPLIINLHKCMHRMIYTLLVYSPFNFLFYFYLRVK